MALPSKEAKMLYPPVEDPPDPLPPPTPPTPPYLYIHFTLLLSFSVSAESSPSISESFSPKYCSLVNVISSSVIILPPLYFILLFNYQINRLIFSNNLITVFINICYPRTSSIIKIHMENFNIISTKSCLIKGLFSA